jgi:hypothetical protein
MKIIGEQIAEQEGRKQNKLERCLRTRKWTKTEFKKHDNKRKKEAKPDVDRTAKSNLSA